MKGFKWVIRDNATGKFVEWAFVSELGMPIAKVSGKPLKFDSEKEIGSYMRRNRLYRYNGYVKEIIKD